MTEINLELMSLDDLKNLQKRVARAIDGYKDREKQKALALLEAKATEMGYTLTELLSGKRSRKNGIPKYRHPDDATKTWTGKGRRPDWVREALASGKSLPDLAI